MKKYKIILPLTALLFILLFCGGCTILGGAAASALEGREVDKKLTTYYNNSPITAARLYELDPVDNKYAFEELPEEELAAFVSTLDAMKLKSHAFHTDYFWGGQYGIEMQLEDGTYLTYDGTRLELRNTPVGEGTDEPIKGGFVEVVDNDFWEQMKTFFPSVEGRGYAEW